MRIWNAFLGWDMPTTRRIEKFTDPSIQQFMNGAHAPIISRESVESIYEHVQTLRAGGRADRALAGCTYLRFAQDRILPAELSEAECFHRAANELRAADVLDRSAQCYFLAAASAFNALPDRYPVEDDKREFVDKQMSLALRSAGRAKAQYAAIGVYDAADEAHRLQKEILRRRYWLGRSWLSAVFWVWRMVTGYGTSVSRWFSWLLADLVFFGVVYGALFFAKLIVLANGAPFAAFSTPIYLSFMNLVAFGAYTQIVPMSPLAELALIFQALTSFVLVGTGLTFLAGK